MPLQRVVDVQRALREITVEIQKAARVVVVLVEDVGPPHVDTAADVVRAAHHRHVGLNRVVAVPVGRRAAGEGREIGTRDPREEAADVPGSASGWTRFPGQNSVESKPIANSGIAPLEEVGVAGAQVEHAPGAEDLHPVADQRAVGAPERKLAGLAGTATDGVPAVADLVPLVFSPAEEDAVVGVDVVVDLADPVPEQVLVEVLGPQQVRLPRRYAGRRAVGLRPVLHEQPGRRVDAVRRDSVARERIADPVAVRVSAPGRRIVDDDLAAQPYPRHR